MARKEIRDTNYAFRMRDESEKWPICGRFNATERAIRRLCRIGYTAMCGSVEEYSDALHCEIMNIVGGEI